VIIIYSANTATREEKKKTEQAQSILKIKNMIYRIVYLFVETAYVLNQRTYQLRYEEKDSENFYCTVNPHLILRRNTSFL
jgi:hypothetical protein